MHRQCSHWQLPLRLIKAQVLILICFFHSTGNLTGCFTIAIGHISFNLLHTRFLNTKAVCTWLLCDFEHQKNSMN